MSVTRFDIEDYLRVIQFRKDGRFGLLTPEQVYGHDKVASLIKNGGLVELTNVRASDILPSIMYKMAHVHENGECVKNRDGERCS